MTNQLGQNLRETRRLRQLTQKQLARASKIHVQTIINIEAGEHSPNLDTIARLANALRTSVSALVDDPSAHGSTTRFLISLRSSLSGASERVRKMIVSLVASTLESPESTK